MYLATFCFPNRTAPFLSRFVSAVTAPSCSVCTYEDSIAAMYPCMCNEIPSIRKYFEMGDPAGLIAPRVLVVAAGKEDKIFPIEGTVRAFEQKQTIGGKKKGKKE